MEGPVVRGLQRAGWDVVRAVDVLPIGTDDPDHFAKAADLRRVVVTHDPDYLELAGDWQGQGREFSGVWFIPPGKYGTVGAVLRAMERQVGREGPPVRFL